MSLASDNINLVDDHIDKEVNNFLANIEKRERGIFNRVLSIAKGLDTDAQGNMLRTTKNLRLLGKIRQEIQDNILTDAYIKDVDKFSGQFESVQKLNNGYFSAIEQSFNPNRQLYRQILKDSVTATKNSLLGAGIEEQVIQPVMQIVSDSVTSGASYGDMVLTLEQKMLGDAENLGTLRRYSQQITKDALNQFNGAYNEAVANTHKLDWFLYLGGRTSKTRPFCKKYHNQYFHRKEVEDFGKGKDLDGSNLCSGSFCAGRIKGTTASNIFRNRGGYNCNHVYKPTQIELVPQKVVRRNIKKGYLADGEDSETLHTTGSGQYTETRQKRHNDIERHFLKGLRPVKKGKTVYMSGGAPANGKSTVIDSGKIKYPKNMGLIDSDKIKAKLPEYRFMVQANDSRAASFAHEESSFISKKILKSAISKDYNALLDGTGDGSLKSLRDKTTLMRSKGHIVKADYVTLDTDLSLKLATIRAKKTGRKVPAKYIKKVNQTISNILPKAIKDGYFDELNLWDTNINGVPRLILSHKDGKTVIHNRKLYSRFLAKKDPRADFSKYKYLDEE